MNKTLALAAVALLVGTAASAAGGFGLQHTIAPDASADIRLVRADHDGSVSIIDNGQVLGTQVIKAGVNPDVRIHLDRAPSKVVTLVLNDAAGRPVTSQRLRVSRD